MKVSLHGQLEERPPRIGTIWNDSTKRPITRADVGKLIVGKDLQGNPISGYVRADSFGVIISEPASLDSRTISADRVALYTLLDAPSVDSR